MKEEMVWAFDIGKASFGEAARQGNRFLHRASLILPEEFAETKQAAKRRRMKRTRDAHKAREGWLEKVWRAVGLEPIYGRNRDSRNGAWKAGEKGDERLEREFAKNGDKTCYTSCLLRIKLLRGEKLEGWQVFKALRAAMQKRGYGKIPWAEREAARKEGKEEEKNDPEYVEAVSRWAEFKKATDPAYHYPCYYDAWRMGLWNSDKPDALREQPTEQARSTRKVRFDRDDVAKEVLTLAERAAGVIPGIAKEFERIRSEGWLEERVGTGRKKTYRVTAKSFGHFLCYGPSGVPFASYFPEHRQELELHLGSNDDWMGALGQKIPRFDNRILEDCALIPRFHVCKAELRVDRKTGKLDPNSLLAAEVTFLMKLKNLRVAGDRGERMLTADEIKQVFEFAAANAGEVNVEKKDWQSSVAKCFSLSKTDWTRTMRGKRKGIGELGLRPLPGQEEVKMPRVAGRSGFSRPALRLIKELILSGKSPKEFHKEALAGINENVDPKKGLVAEDLKFLEQKMGESWEKLFIPSQRIESIEAKYRQDGQLDAEAAIKELIGSVKDPIVRHRLGFFTGRLKYLREEMKLGVPDTIVLEFVREDFMSPKRKMELQKFQRERENARKEAREMAAEAGVEERSAPLKYELFKAQGCACLYCGQPFHATKLGDYDIDHIVPRTQGGPDAMINLALAHRQCNEAKDNRTPYQWLKGGEGWDGYVERVKSRATALRNKKVQLLVREDSAELVERYTALAETAWISKLAQTVASFYFGWRNGIDAEGRRRIRIISGGLTARIRRMYRLNSLLNRCPEGEDPFLWEETCEKNREDQRHHALDAMVISYIPGWMMDSKKERFFRFPEPIHKNARDFFRREIDQVVPRMAAFEKPVLAETIYGARVDNGERVIVQRVALRALAMKAVAPGKEKFELAYLRKNIPAIRDAAIRKTVLKFAESEPEEGDWKRFCDEVRIIKKNGQPGSRIEKVLLNVGEPAEYREMSKDGTGAWRKGLGSHKGQIIYRDEGGVIQVRPVFAHGSLREERKKIKALGGQAEFYGFFNSDCAIRTKKEIPAEKYKLVIRNEAKQKRRVSAEEPLPPGELTLRNIVTMGRIAELTLPNNKRIAVTLQVLIEAGLERA